VQDDKISYPSGDVNRAAMYMSNETRANSRALFNGLNTQGVLGQFAAGLSDMQIVTIKTHSAAGDLRFTEGVTEFSYYVLFVKDDDGVWRIHSF